MQKLNDSQRQLVEQNIRLVGFALKKMGIDKANGSFPDLVGAGYLGLCLAALKWRNEGAAFSGFAYHLIRCEIIRELKNEERFKKPAPLYMQYESLGEALDIERAELKILFEQFLKASELLSEHQKQVFIEFIKGSDTRITAEHLGLSVSSVLKHKAEACGELRKFVADK